jgi:hypothetical protein
VALVLNAVRASFSAPDISLPCISLPSNLKPHDIYPEYRLHAYNERLVFLDNELVIVFPQGRHPNNSKIINRIFDISSWKPLDLILAEIALAKHFEDQGYIVSGERIGRRNWSYLALRKQKEFKHLSFFTGLYFRGLAIESRPCLVIDWKARADFNYGLEDPEIRSIAKGCPVVVAKNCSNPNLADRKGRFLGIVESVSDGAIEVKGREDNLISVRPEDVRLEGSPKMLSHYEKSFRQYAPRQGSFLYKAELDKSLVGGLKNKEAFGDRLKLALDLLGPQDLKFLSCSLPADLKRSVAFDLSPFEVGQKEERLIYTSIFPQPLFEFKDRQKHDTNKKTNGLLKFGPFKSPEKICPRIGFLFAEEHRNDARKLFTALKDGVGLYRGFRAFFGIEMDKNLVSSFAVDKNASLLSPLESSLKYEQALRRGMDALNAAERPDLVFVVHNRTDRDDDISPYYACKGALLSYGIMAQSVTVDLLEQTKQFEWAAANIAMAAFTKLGGQPWSIEPISTRRSLIIGVGRTERRNEVSRERTIFQAYSTCISSTGRFGFVAVYPEFGASSEALQHAAREALREAEKLAIGFDSIVIHLTGELPREDIKAVRDAVSVHPFAQALPVAVVSISERSDLFAVTKGAESCLPSRGQFVRVDKRRYLLFTEGKEDTKSFRDRLPCCVNVVIRDLPEGMDPKGLLAQVYDLSQINFRALNAASKPVTLLYSDVLARFIQHQNVSSALANRPELNQRMWFL